MSNPNEQDHSSESPDPDSGKGAVAQDRPGQPNNVADLNQQIDHRDQQPMKKGKDTDFPEPGNSPEYSMQKQDKITKQEQDPNLSKQRQHDIEDKKAKSDPDGNSSGEISGETNDQEPGFSQERNQGDKKDDDLAA